MVRWTILIVSVCRVERYAIVRIQINELRKSIESATGSVRVDTLG